MPDFLSESAVAATELADRKFGRRAPRATVVSAPPDRYFVVKVRGGGPGSAALSTENPGAPIVDLSRPKFRSGASETSVHRDRNSGSTLRHGGRRVSAHAAGMGPRPKEFA